MTPTSEHACEYGRCGGLGEREVARRYRARCSVFAAGRWWDVCESCSSLLLREAREDAARWSDGAGPAGVGDVVEDLLDDRPEWR